MRKLITSLSVAAMVLASTPALAQYSHRHGYRAPPPRHHVFPRHRHNNYAPWIAGAIGLGVLGSMYYYNNRQCWDVMVGYDRYGREVIERQCR